MVGIYGEGNKFYLCKAGKNYGSSTTSIIHNVENNVAAQCIKCLPGSTTTYKSLSGYHTDVCKCKHGYGKILSKSTAASNGNYCEECKTGQFSDMEDLSICRSHKTCPKGKGRVNKDGYLSETKKNQSNSGV